jgi:signal recognition particle receptor subunit beta
LHHVLHALVSLPPSQKAPALAIIAHKSDLLKAPAGGPPASQLAVARVRTILERELERRRTARAGGVGVEGTDAETEELGGLDGSTPFRFADWEGGPVDILGASVTVGQTLNDEKAEDGLAQFREWLEGL